MREVKAKVLSISKRIFYDEKMYFLRYLRTFWTIKNGYGGGMC